MGTCPVHIVSSDGDLLGLGSSSVLSGALMEGRHDDAVHVESSRTHSHWDPLCLCPQNWAGTPTVYRTRPVCVCTPHTPWLLRYLLCGRFQGWLLQLWQSSCWVPHLAADGVMRICRWD